MKVKAQLALNFILSLQFKCKAAEQVLIFTFTFLWLAPERILEIVVWCKWKLSSRVPSPMLLPPS